LIVRSEKVSAASRDGRPELAIVIEFLREGDELVVTLTSPRFPRPF
jgi:DNA invertase Pin-like site-specific DNA recombinase